MNETVTAPTPSAPFLVAANQPRARFYEGGERIAAFRGSDSHEPHTPEDWVASTVNVRGDEASGRTIFSDGTTLADAIANDPEAWLGPAHVARFGADPMLLLKLLDAGQRLPIHAHPDGGFARTHVGTAHGKHEAWYILEPGIVYLGLREPLDKAHAFELVRRQDVASLLDRMHAIEVGVGDRVFVPAGLLHAIGAGILLVEAQEPEDLSILLEWRGFDLDGAKDGHLGLGFDRALDAVRLSASSAREIDALIVRADDERRGLVQAADPFFRLTEVTVDGQAEVPEGFAIVVGLEGELRCDDVVVTRGSTLVMAAAARSRALRGTGSVLIAQPPAA